MSRRHEQIAHRRQLSEIRNIMNSMKTLAIMESHKLERYIETQTALIASIENIASDFLHFNSHVLPETEPTLKLILLIGSERGFCGGFNEELLTKSDQLFPDTIESDKTFIIVGNKLHSLFNKTNHNIIYVDGAGVVEEIPSVMNSLSEIFTSQKKICIFICIAS